MSVMIVELYEALKAAGAPEDKAQAAAKSLANDDARFDKLERRIDALDHRLDLLDARFDALETKMDARFAAVDSRFASIEAQIAMLKWMLGIVIAGIVALIVKAFFP